MRSYQSHTALILLKRAHNVGTQIVLIMHPYNAQFHQKCSYIAYLALLLRPYHAHIAKMRSYCTHITFKSRSHRAIFLKMQSLRLYTALISFLILIFMKRTHIAVILRYIRTQNELISFITRLYSAHIALTMTVRAYITLIEHLFRAGFALIFFKSACVALTSHANCAHIAKTHSYGTHITLKSRYF